MNCALLPMWPSASRIKTVKVTGGQRIDLLGVKKADLPAVWAQLNAAGLVSGAAYAKGLRTVKTCVGSEWCRFGTQDSTGLGVKLERFLCGSWTPAKVKLGVSGCPRNCAEATVQGHRHHLRRVRLRHPHRGRRRPARARDRSARPCRHRGRGHRIRAPRSRSSIASRRAYLEARLEVGREGRPRQGPRRDHGRSRRPQGAASNASRNRSTPCGKTRGPNAPPAASCTSSCRWPVLAPIHAGRCANERRHETRDKNSGSTSARCMRFPRAARARCRTPRREIAVFRTAGDEVVRAGEQVPAQGRVLWPTASCTAARSRARCTTGSSISRTARRPAPTRAARAAFRSRSRTAASIST